MARWRLVLALVLLASALAFTANWRVAAAPAGDVHLPDFVTQIPLDKFSIVRPTPETREFRYTHFISNLGDGPFEVRPVYDPATDSSQGFQRLYTHNSADEWSLVSEHPVVGKFLFHAQHGHFHIKFAKYGLFHVAADGSVGSSAADSEKIGYCIADSQPVDFGIPHYGAFGYNDPCWDPNAMRGISVGWGDRYDFGDHGQAIDVTNLPDGVYWFRAVSDPFNYFVEKDEANNGTDILLEISGDTVTVLNGPFSPNTQPPSVSMTAPAAGAVAGAVLVSANATDPSGITSVQFVLDGNPLSAPLVAPPYDIQWDTTTVPDGTHYLSATAKAGSLFYGTAMAVTVSVSNGAPPPPPPPSPLSISNVFAGDRTSSSATVTWTTNVPANGTVEYGLDTTYGQSAGDPALVTTHAVPLSGLSPSTTYHYKVTSQDAEGNVATAGDFIFTTAAESELSCTITAPLPGETVSGTIPVSAESHGTASILGVQFTLDGNNLGAEDVQDPYSIDWNTTLTGDGVHQIRAIARDPTQNVALCGPVSVTVSNAAPVSALVLALGFNEGTSSTAADASGYGNQGSLSGPAWVDGRYGKALSFDGLNDVVTVNDSNSLDLVGPMTLEAWVNPRTLAGWRTVILKERPAQLAYALYGNTDSNQPSVEVAVGSNVDARAASQLQLDAWSHLAATYDGATLRLYLNGTQVGSQPVSGGIVVSASPLRIGGNLVWGEYFDGLLDEIRMYNRALTASELVTDMNTPIGGAPPADTTPPSRANGQPSGTLAAGTTSAALQLTTDEAATCRYAVSAGTGYAAMTSTFATTGGTAHSTTVSGLLNGNTYTYYVRCSDAAGNANTTDFPISFTIATPPADTTSPTRTNGQPTGTLAAGTTSATLQLTTNEAATCRYAVSAGTSYAAMPNVFSTTGGTAHATLVSGLADGNTYSYFVRCSDVAGNVNTSDFTISFAVASGTGSLVAAFGFNEVSGTTVQDASGRGNTGTMTNVTRTTAGRYGGALVFNGTNAWVTVADSASLDLTNGMTLEAWVRPTAAMSTSWRSILVKEQFNGLSYSLYANTPASRPGTYINVGGPDLDVQGSATIPTNSWTHLAATFNGTTLQLYVSGTLVRSAAISGALVTSSGALRIGGNAVWGEYFKGHLDEVRIYNRALSAAEIATDMNTAIVP